MERSLFPREHWQVMISSTFNHFSNTYTHLSITLFSDVNNTAIWEWKRTLFFSWKHKFSIKTGNTDQKHFWRALFSQKNQCKCQGIWPDGGVVHFPTAALTVLCSVLVAGKVLVTQQGFVFCWAGLAQPQYCLTNIPLSPPLWEWERPWHRT